MQIKDKVKERYGKIAASGNTENCCMPGDCCSPSSNIIPISSLRSQQAAKSIGYGQSELESIPSESILGVGCGAPTRFADIKEGEVVVDLGSGAGIDVFIAANKVGQSGKAIGIDMTDEMLEKARSNARTNGYTNVEFRKGDIEETLPVDDNSVDLVISNCVINLTVDKTATFRQVYRILKDGGRMIISDLVTDKEVHGESVDAEKWCECIDGALTRENYLESIRQADFSKIEVINEVPYIKDSEQTGDGRNVSSITVKAVKGD